MMKFLQAHLIERPTVFHVGTLVPDQKGHFHADGLEGHCLSVSLHPEAWIQIARLGGESVWRLDHASGVFVDILSLEADSAAANAVRAWGIEQGLSQIKTCWRAWQYDSEEDDWRYMIFDDEKEAHLNADEFEDREGGNVECVSLCVGTPALCEIIGWKDASTKEVLDFLVLAYLEGNVPEVQGVWWNEILDPGALSAPRAGILPSKLHEWQRSASSIEEAMAFREALEEFDGAPFVSRPSFR